MAVAAKPRPNEWAWLCLSCRRVRYTSGGFGPYQCSALGEGCDDYGVLERHGCRWGREWMMLAALSVACESSCELHPTEIMKVLRPEIYIGPGMVIDEEI